MEQHKARCDRDITEKEERKEIWELQKQQLQKNI